MPVSFIVSNIPTTTRERIIQKSAELFLTKGYVSTSIDDILSAAEIAKGTFYHHFVSKDALLETVTEKFASSGYEALMQKLNQTKTDNPLATLNFLFRANMEWKSENIESIILSMEAMIDPANIILRHSFANKRKKMMMPILIKILTDGKKIGIFDFKDPAMTAEIMINLLTQLFDYLIEDIFFDQSNNASLARHNYQFAIERILGLPENSIRPIDWASYNIIKEKIKTLKTNRKKTSKVESFS